MRELVRQGTSFHVWGTIFYEDVFKTSRRTNFSFLIAVPGQKRVGIIWRTTDKHNYAT